MKRCLTLLFTLLAVILFSPLFIVRQVGPFDFWYWMSANLIIVITLGWLLDPSYRTSLKTEFRDGVPKKILLGLASAVILYFVFFFGNYLSRLLFDFAGEGIANVYAFKGDAAGIRIALLMLLVIGPGEELFWRGFLQRRFENRLGKWRGFLLATVIYTGVHLFTGNIMLIVAALVAGLFWGWMYMRYKSMVMNVVSHTVWDIAVFLLLPFY
ncbi:MAG: type II CAAX endopeptidase family protein, partial [Bacteroidales bacterium]